MSMTDVMQSSTAVVCKLANKPNLQEFEVFAYIQACRTLESVFKNVRETLEGEFDELGNLEE